MSTSADGTGPAVERDNAGNWPKLARQWAQVGSNPFRIRISECARWSSSFASRSLRHARSSRCWRAIRSRDATTPTAFAIASVRMMPIRSAVVIPGL